MANDVIYCSSDESDVDLPEIATETLGTKKRPVPTESSTQAKPDAPSETKSKKQKLAEERAAKKSANERNKIYKPGECMKYMNVEGHPLLWSSWWCADVSREVTATGAKVVPSPQMCHPSLVTWTRTIPRTLNSDGGELKLSPSVEPCDHALYVCPAEELAEHVTDRTLASHLGEIRMLANCDVTLVVFGVKDYFKSDAKRKTSNSNKKQMTEIDLELSVTDLLVSSECDTVLVNTPNELALLIVQFTKAIAEAPYKKSKRACDENAEYYMKGDNKKCIAIDRDGAAVGKAWQQMIAVLPNSSLEKSRAVCGKYKTPLTLFQALQEPNATTELANIGVSRAAVPGSKARRVGPEFARKLALLFTATDGDTLVE